MSIRFVFLPPGSEEMADQIRHEVPELEVVTCGSRQEALAALPMARGAFGSMDPELLKAAPQLQWLACPAAGPSPSFYFPELIASPVTVTNSRGIYNDHISNHIMAFVLIFSRRMQRYFPAQFRGEWLKGGEGGDSVYLPEATALIIGVGGIGGATARHCSYFGMHVIGIDPRVSEAPADVGELYRPPELDQHLGRADFVIMTAPQTPGTQRLIDKERLGKMKKTAVFINIGRGSNVVLDDLSEALYAGTIGGAALDVYDQEPLPGDHPFLRLENTIISPHMAYVTEENLIKFHRETVEDIAGWLNGSPVRVLE